MKTNFYICRDRERFLAVNFLRKNLNIKLYQVKFEVNDTHHGPSLKSELMLLNFLQAQKNMIQNNFLKFQPMLCSYQ
jgi:hypothetical protein